MIALFPFLNRILLLNGMLFLLVCAAAWLVLPVLLMGGGLALFSYAVVVELGAALVGAKSTLPDGPTARRMANRMCGT